VQKIKDCLFADDVLYDTERNAWVRMEGGLAFVGIDTALAWLSGPFSYVSFKAPGTVVERGKSLGGVEGPRHFDTVKSPLTGRIVLVNSALVENPKLLNNDPYGRGWFAKIEPLKLDEEKDALLGIAAARPFLEKKITDMNIRCFAEFPDYEMYEIGSECAGILVKLDDLIARSTMGTVVHLVSDEPTSEIEMIGWSERTHQELVEVRKEGKLFHFIVKKTA
jgi:glycine cleavage system H protein